MDKAHNRIVWQNSPSVATPLGATILNQQDIALDAIDNRVVAMDTSKANVTTINAMVRDITFNNADGKLTITYQSGTTSIIDTAMEKIVTNFSYNATTQSIDLTLADGSTQSIDVSSFVTNVDFENTSTVAWSVVEGKTRATVPDGSITDAKIESGYLANVTTQAGIATTQAALSKRYAVGGVVEGDATDNAKYYYEQAQAIVGIDIATTEVAGIVKPDGTTIDVDVNGKISVNKTITAETVGSGVLYNSGLVTSAQATPNMTVAISTGTAFLPTGARVTPTAVASQTITTADATNPRKDITYVNSSGVIAYLAGTASATPTAPSLPSGGVLLAEIYVGAGVTTITTANITDKRSIIKSNADLTAISNYKTMGIVIDLTNSNPLTSVTYMDDAVGMTVGSKQWDDFFGHYPCILKDGAETVRLNPNDFTKDINGNTIDLASATVGDVMIAFPILGLKINTYGTTVYVKMTNNPDDPTYEYNAHTRGTVRKDKFYLGAYKGYVDSSKLRSWSGKTPTVSQTIGTFRTHAQANGTGYDQSAFYQLIFRQCMYILKYKNLDSQTTLGRGYVDGNSAAINTGGTNAKGMDFGETGGKLQMKLFGIEDFWGNVLEWIDGLVTDASRNMLTANSSFNDTGAGYTNNGQGATADIGNYMSKPQGGTKTGFIAKELTGSETTYFCDAAALAASCVAFFGGSWSNASSAGAFRLSVGAAASYSNAGIAGRLMYL